MEPSTESAARILAAAARGRDRRGDGDGPGLVLLGLEVRRRSGAPLPGSALERVASAAAAEVREGDVVTHLGSGRFAVLLTGLWDLQDVAALEGRLSDVAARACGADAPSPLVAVAVVVNLDPSRGMTEALDALERLLPPAPPGESPDGGAPDAAPFTAREVGEALASGALSPYYQPVADLDGRAAGAEALLRWQHPARGLLAPVDFLDAALDRVGPVAIGEAVLSSAVAQVAAWEAVADLEYYRVGINLSPPHLEGSDVAGTVERLLEEHGVSGRRLLVEILESDAITSWDRMATTVLHLRALGLRVAIDDFGSGHAGVDWLRDLPIDMVKVDRSLVGPSPDAKELLGAVIGAAHAAGADVLLEGVETVEQLALAREVGAGFVQGLLVGAPQPPGELPLRPAPWPAGA